MFKFKYLSALVGTLFLIEINQQPIVSKVSACSLYCDDGFRINYETCACVEKTWSNIKDRKTRSLDNVAVSKLIRADVFASRRCANDEYWNGSACISTLSLCPGGYHFNGNACIIQTTIQTAALVPSAPNKKCKFAQQKEAEETKAAAAYMQLPLTVVPTFSTSPMCPFGFIWLGNKCVQNPPLCPSGYVYHDNMCHLNSQRVTGTTTETATREITPSITDIFKENVTNENKWQQKPFGRDLNVHVQSTEKYKAAKEIQHSGEIEMFQDLNGQPCCTIMSPRICQRSSSQSGGRWQCYHHEHRRCGDFCTKPTIYMRPKQFSFNEPLLIMPPPPPRLMKLMQNYAFRETNIGKQ